MPPALHRGALSACGQLLRRGLEHRSDSKFSESSWGLAQLGVANGGLGLRDPERHAGLAYVASVTQTRKLCKRIDSGFDEADAAGGLFLAATANEVNRLTLEAAATVNGLEPVSQKIVGNGGRCTETAPGGNQCFKPNVRDTR